MQRLLYIIITSIKCTFRNKSINFITLMSFTIGMFFSAFILVMGSSLLNDLNETKIEDISRIVKVNGRAVQGKSYKTIPVDDIGQLIRGFKELDCINIVISSSNLVVHNNKCDLTRDIFYVTKDFSNMYKNFVHTGKWFNIEEYNNGNLKCIIGSKVALTYFGNSNALKQKIEVNNQIYEIIGTTDNIKYKEGIIIPISQYTCRSISDITDYYFKFTSSEINYENIKSYINDTYGSYKFVELDKEYELEYNRIFKGALTIFIVSCVVLMFSIVNTIGIFLHRINESKRRIATQIAFGAKKIDIFLQNFFEICTLAFVSSMIVYNLVIAVSKLSDVMPVDVSVDLSILFILVTTGIIVSCLISFVLLVRIFSLQISDVFRG